MPPSEGHLTRRRSYMSDQEKERDEPEEKEQVEEDLELREEDAENVRGGLSIKVQSDYE